MCMRGVPMCIACMHGMHLVYAWHGMYAWHVCMARSASFQGGKHFVDRLGEGGDAPTPMGPTPSWYSAVLLTLTLTPSPNPSSKPHSNPDPDPNQVLGGAYDARGNPTRGRGNLSHRGLAF